VNRPPHSHRCRPSPHTNPDPLVSSAVPKAPPRSRKAAAHGAGAEQNCGSAACNAIVALFAHTNVWAQLFLRCDPSPSSCTLCYWVLGRALCSVLGVGVTVPYRGKKKNNGGFEPRSPRLQPGMQAPTPKWGLNTKKLQKVLYIAYYFSPVSVFRCFSVSPPARLILSFGPALTKVSIPNGPVG
jgi:hypothetical protein